MIAPANLYEKQIIYSNLKGTGVFTRFNTGTDISMKFEKNNRYVFTQVGNKRTGAPASYIYKKTKDHLGKIVNIIDSEKGGLKGCLMNIHLNFKTGKGYTKVALHTTKKNVKDDKLTFNFRLE